MAEAASATTRTDPIAVATFGSAYSGYVLFVLFLANMFNSIDRSIVNILVEPIRHEFGFSDLHMGAISGLGFALFFSLFGIPIARLADRSSRKNLLAFGVTLWSAMTILTGRAVGFWSMLGARVGVGIGEATCLPTAVPLISDYFTKEKRPRAIALFQVGLHVGIIVGAVTAGLMADRYGWRAAFYVLGIPGVLLGLLIFFTVREPVRGAKEIGGPTAMPVQPPSFGDFFTILSNNRPFLLLVLATTFLSVGSATMASWGPAFLMRVHDVSQAEVGVTIGPIFGLSGLAGTLLGGFLGTRLAQKSTLDRAPLLVPLWTTLPAAPALLLALLAPTLPLMLLGGGIGAFLTATHFGPLIAVAVSNIDPAKRSSATAIIVIGQVLLGFGIGPLFVGGVSDLLEGSLGIDALRYAMLAAPISVVIAWCLIYAAWRSLGKRQSAA